jgi:hypothetical protein
LVVYSFYCLITLCFGGLVYVMALIGRSQLYLALWHAYFETRPSFVLFFFGMVHHAFRWFILVIA